MSSLSALSMISIRINTALLVNHNIFEVICCALYMHHVHVLYMFKAVLVMACELKQGPQARTRYAYRIPPPNLTGSLPVTLGRGVDEAVA